MLRSMYSGISGMKVNQTKLDVIGNNIANLGTTGFKSSTVKFQEMLSQNVSDATAPTANKGGVNAKQVGLGVQLASIDTVMTQGMLQPTGRSLDIALDGAGFFMVSKGPESFGNNDISLSHKSGAHTITNSGSSEMMYTRAGTFILDQSGNLLTSDGYRVMGYPLTNDDNGMSPTGQNPVDVSTAGLDFRFGPGSQLNGYKIVLGAVGPETVTDAEIDKGSKIIKISGDFSTTSTLTAEAVETAINKSLSSSGISQRVYATGKPAKLPDLGSERVEGGSDATSPNSVSLMGVTFKFSEGSNLNGYSIKIGDIQDSKIPGKVFPSAEVNTDEKIITLNANFMEKGATTAEELADIITSALSVAGINQTVTGIGIPSQIPGLEATSGEGSNGNPPLSIKDPDDDTKVIIDFTAAGEREKLNALNGYKISFTKSKDTDVTVDKNEKTIKILYKDETVATAKEIEAAINDKFNDISLSIDMTNVTDGFSATISGGKEKKAPEAIEIGGFKLKFPKGEEFNDIKFRVVDIEADKPNVEVVKDNKGKIKEVKISGNFLENGVLSATSLEKLINDQMGINPGVIVEGRAKIDIDSESEIIDGGAEFKAPVQQELFGMTFEFEQGASLNGYKIVMGDISATAKTSAKVSEKDKLIVINGNFVRDGATSNREIQNVINKALKESGIDQQVSISGKPTVLGNTESLETMYGTPVQSIGEDGVITFVDGTQEVKAYDEGLKTLRIPETVRIPGTDKELKVKSFNIDGQGIINCILEDGSVAAVGQLAIANFKNPEGLTKVGSNLYSVSANSGNATIRSGVGTTGEDNSKGFASLVQGMVEMSNVDLSEQFTDMITTTRAFQASGKIINTGDEILQDIINLKR